MAAFHFNVDMDRRPQNEWLYTMKLAAGITAEHIGRAVALTGPNTVGLAADGVAIFGRLEVVEDNGLGTISLKFVEGLPILTGETVAVGNTVVGAGNGFVKAAATASHANTVVEVRGTSAIVLLR